jgi:hypothetical protein
MTIIACNITKQLNVYVAFSHFDVYKFALKCTHLCEMVCTTAFYESACYIMSVALYILTRIQEEFRPQEKRDKTDYTETTALSALANCAPRVLCNEDIYTLDVNYTVTKVTGL